MPNPMNAKPFWSLNRRHDREWTAIGLILFALGTLCGVAVSILVYRVTGSVLWAIVLAGVFSYSVVKIIGIAIFKMTERGRKG